MKRSRIAASLAALVIAGFSVIAISQPDTQVQKQAPAQTADPAPGPSEEHKRLQTLVGTWDADMEMHWGGPAMNVKGVETVRALGPFFVVSEFKADMGGMPFEGHGVFGYDPFKKQSTGYWVDSMGPVGSPSVGTYDAKTKTVTMTMDSVDPTGKTMKMKETEEMPDDDTRIFKMYSFNEDGTESLAMKIEYKRRK